MFIRLKYHIRNILKACLLPNFWCDLPSNYVGKKSGYYIHKIPVNKHRSLFVLSAGVGLDIDFELELIRLYPTARIILLDPSPVAIETISRIGSELSNSITYMQLALAPFDGSLKVASQGKNQIQRPRASTNKYQDSDLSFESISCQTILEQQCVNYIDILKLDIEGFEYDVLPSLLDSPIRIGQICVELHDWMYGFQYRIKTLVLLRKLLHRGYFLVKRVHNDYTFVHESILEK